MSFSERSFLGVNPFWICLLGEALEFPHGMTSLGLNETSHGPCDRDLPHVGRQQMQSQSAQPWVWLLRDAMIHLVEK